MKAKGVAALVMWTLGSGVLVHAEQAPEDRQVQARHDYLRVDGQTVISRHALPYSVDLAEGFVFRNELDYELEFNDIPYNVSVVIFESDQALALVWAETMPEGYGRLDYSSLEADSIEGVHFNVRKRCFDIRTVPEEEITGIPVHGALVELGLARPVLQRQYFATSEDGLAEYALSYERKVDSCDEASVARWKELGQEAVEIFLDLKPWSGER